MEKKKPATIHRNCKDRNAAGGEKGKTRNILFMKKSGKQAM